MTQEPAAVAHPDGAALAPPLTTRAAKWLWPLLWLLALGAVGLGVHLVGEFAEGGSYGFDTRILLALRVPGHPNTPIGPKWLEQSAIDLSALGGFTLQWLLGALAVGFLALARRRAEAAWLTASILGASVANSLIKLVVDRPRPTVVDHLANVSNASFPSGHAMISTAILLTLAAMLAETQRSAAARTYLMATAGALSLLIGLSRIYLGVHWPTDVLAGWCFGAVWALVVFAANRALRRRAARLPVGGPREQPELSPRCRVEDGPIRRAGARPVAIFNKDIIALATKNTNFQQEVYYDAQCQIVMMHLQPGEDIGEETHDADQTTFVVSGEGQAKIDGHTTKISPNHIVVVPKGAEHNFINKGDEPMKIFTVYAPPAEEKGISHKTKAEAEAAEED